MTSAPAPEHINLAIGGAGVCGAAEAGAAAALAEHGFVVDNVAGTSAGSMIGAAIAAHMSPPQLRELAVSLDYPSLQLPANRVVSYLVRVPVVGRWIAWNFLGGAYSLDNLRKTVDGYLGPLGSLTWADHQARVARGEAANLNIVAFNLNEGEQAVFPGTYQEELGLNSADRPISEAIAASVAMPTFFRPPRITDAAGNDWIYSDGGTINEVPFDVAAAMNSQLRTMAVRISSPREYTAYPTSAWLLGVKLLLRIVGTAGSAVAQQRMERPEIIAATIAVPTLGVDPNDFGLTKVQAGQLFDAGYQAALAWIAADVARRGAQAPPAPAGPARDSGGLAA